jgi:hypothetical protein
MVNVHPDASSIHLLDEWNLYPDRRAPFPDGHAANLEVVTQAAESSPSLLVREGGHNAMAYVPQKMKCKMPVE